MKLNYSCLRAARARLTALAAACLASMAVSSTRLRARALVDGTLVPILTISIVPAVAVVASNVAHGIWIVVRVIAFLRSQRIAQEGRIDVVQYSVEHNEPYATWEDAVTMSSWIDDTNVAGECCSDAGIPCNGTASDGTRPVPAARVEYVISAAPDGVHWWLTWCTIRHSIA